MNKPRPIPTSNAVRITPVSRGPVQAWTRFWFSPVDPVGLHIVRLLAGLLFIAWLLPFAGQIDAFFGMAGWFDEQAFHEAGKLEVGPAQPVGWYLSFLYLLKSNSALLATAYWGSIVVLALYALGIWARLTAVLAWLIVISFTASPAIAYEGDALLVILAFYIMIGYVLLGQWQNDQPLSARLLGSRDMVLLGTQPAQPSVGANIGLRLLQVHLAIVIVTSGLAKLQFGDWWSGAAFWYPLHPPFQTTIDQAQEVGPHKESYLTFLSLAAYSALAWQIGFPAFAWRPRWRMVLLGGALLGWLTCSFIYELPVFGPAIFIGCLAYVTPAEWRRVLAMTGLDGLLANRQADFSETASKKANGPTLVASR